MPNDARRPEAERPDLAGSIPFVLIHLLPLGAFWSGVNGRALALFAGLWLVRKFAITAGYHRYFAHRAYKMGRAMQFLMAWIAASAAQKGPLWWAGHHRHHHRFSDTDMDVHSPIKGIWWAHVGWILCDKFKDTPVETIKDLARFPELRWLDRWHLVPPVALALGCFAFGGWSGLFFGFALSTVVLYHTTFLVNSAAHLMGRRRYATEDTSRNSLLVAVLTLGEGWHNNHHHFQATARAGFYWWELDITWYVLKLMSWVGLVRELNPLPEKARARNRIDAGEFDTGMFQAFCGRAQSSLEQARANFAAYCLARKESLQAYVHATSRSMEELSIRNDGAASEGHREAIEGYLASARKRSRQLIEDMRKDTRRYCKQRERALRRFHQSLRRNAGAAFEQSHQTLEQALLELRLYAEELARAVQDAADELARLFAAAEAALAASAA